MSISEFGEVLKQQEQVLDVAVPAVAALGVTYLVIAGGYLAMQKVRKKMEDETDKKRAVIVVSLMSTLLLVVAAAIVISIVRRMDSVIRGFREGAPGWADSVQTEAFQSRLLKLDLQYTVLFWGGVALTAVLIAVSFFLIRRIKCIYGELKEQQPVLYHTKGLIAVTSSIIPEYDGDEESGCTMEAEDK